MVVSYIQSSYQKRGPGFQIQSKSKLKPKLRFRHIKKTIKTTISFVEKRSLTGFVKLHEWTENFRSL